VTHNQNLQENALDSIYSLRSSVSLGYTSDENAISDVALRIGADKQFLSSKNWRFYTGVDLSYTYSTINNADKNTQNFGALFLLGFMLKLGNHFSFSSEPSLSVLRYSTKDDQSFNPKANRKWTEIQFLNIGQINMNFHF